LVKVIYINGFEIPVDVDDNGNSNGCFRSRDCNHNQTEEMSMEQIWIKELVEYHKIYIHRIEYQLDGHQHGNQISSRQKPVDADKEHQGTDNKKCVKRDIVYHDFDYLSGLFFV
jgi:hypothetical protein